MFHFKLLELESELLAQELGHKGLSSLSIECVALLEFLERQIGVRLGDRVLANWRGWLFYRRKNNSLIICRGRAFSESGHLDKHIAGVDVLYGYDLITEYKRGFDITPPQDIDHLLVNFGCDDNPRIFLWYGENLAEYKLIFQNEVADDPHHEISEAVVEACVWILTRPKEKTLFEFLKDIEKCQKKDK